MPKGGKRAGAGRKPGSLTRKTREIAEQAAQDGITPLEVMLQAMKAHHTNGKFDEAAAIAKDAAPYCHPRLAAVEMSGKDGGPLEYADLTDAERNRRITALFESAGTRRAGSSVGNGHGMASPAGTANGSDKSKTNH